MVVGTLTHLLLLVSHKPMQLYMIDFNGKQIVMLHYNIKSN